MLQNDGPRVLAGAQLPQQGDGQHGGECQVLPRSVQVPRRADIIKRGVVDLHVGRHHVHQGGGEARHGHELRHARLPVLGGFQQHPDCVMLD